MKLADLAPTQQLALRHAFAGPLSRARGGYSNDQCADDPHTVRCINALERSNLIELTALRGTALITPRGRALVEAADKQTVTPSSIAA